MAGSPRILQAFYRVSSAFWIPTLAWAATWWPRALMYWMARWLVMVPFNLVRPKYLRAIKGNYARILGCRWTTATCAARLGTGFQHAFHWVDFFRYSQWPPERLAADVAGPRARSTSTLPARAVAGRCCSPPIWGTRRSARSARHPRRAGARAFYWRDRFATAEEFRTRMRLRGNVHGIAVDTSPLSVVPAYNVLREGGILACARRPRLQRPGVAGRVLRRTGEVPPGPFLLAARAGAVIVPTFFLLEPDRRFLVVYEPPIPMDGDGSLEERARRGLAAFVAILERRIREFPEQWYCFYPFWSEAGKRQEATGNRQQATGNRQQATGNSRVKPNYQDTRECIQEPEK